MRIRHRRDAAAAGAGRRRSSPRSRPACPCIRTDGRTVDDIVADGLRGRGLTLAVAESCTGGLLGARLTARPGSSDYFLGGVDQLREPGEDGPPRRARRACWPSTAPSPRRSPAPWPRARARALRADYALSRHRRRRPRRRHAGEAGRPRLRRLRRARAARACASGSFPGDRDSVRDVQRDRGAAPAARGALAVSGAARPAGAPAPVRRLRPARRRRARRRRPGSDAELRPHDDLRLTPTPAPHAGVSRRASTRRACPTSSASLGGDRLGAAPTCTLQGAALPAGAAASAGSSRSSSTTRRGALRAAAGGGVGRRSRPTGLYEPEKRPWLPHVTVARFRRPGHPFSLQNVNIPAVWCRPDGPV